MHCPICVHPELEEVRQDDILIDICPQCQGRWYDHHELDQLEDQANDRDERKGQLRFETVRTDARCPRCGDQLDQFIYRGYDITLEGCPQECGFWLDAGEEEQILAAMRRKLGDQSRKDRVEGEFHRWLAGSRSGGLMARIRRWFE